MRGTGGDPMTVLEHLHDLGALTPLDLHFARALARLAPKANADALLGAAFANRAPSRGDVCADLTRLADLLPDDLPPDTEPPPLPDPDAWVESLRQSGLCRAPGEPVRAPLVLDGHALYLDRVWRYQARLVNTVRARLERPFRDDVDPALLRAGLERLFPADRLPPGVDCDRQRLAALLAVRRGFTVITGGPGTGKTTTVVKVLALLVEQAHARDQRLRIALVAPTGKAAARMSEAIRKHKAPDRLAVADAVRDAIPDEASTIHRRLGFRWGSVRFAHDADHPLPVDVVVVDEASMVDLALMAKLLAAVPPHARLVLLGDEDQLASVEAGAVLGDLCRAGAGPMSTATGGRVAEVGDARPPDQAGTHDAPRMADAAVRLTHAWRFGPDSGIRALAAAINAGDAAAALECFAAHDDLTRLDPPAPHDQDGLARALRALTEVGYGAVAQAPDPEAALAALAAFRVLCAHRRGPRGVAALNGQIERWLAAAGHVHPAEPWYPGRPILITRNDAPLRLFNGDVGVVRDTPAGRRAFFPADGGRALRAFNPARLPPHDTVFATTVHKSQGSEFDHVVVVLPDRPSPLLTRELLYTAVTRASARVTVLGSPDVLAAGVEAQVKRVSDLGRLLAR